MNILITGGNGFLAKELIKYFSKSKTKCNLLVTNRKTLDPTDYESVKSFFNEVKVDIVIHTAVRGGKRSHFESIDDIFENIAMFQNLSKFSDKFKLMFNFGSGAEFDRRFDINGKMEIDIFKATPVDFYGLAKNLITRKIYEMDSNIYNLRLFGCFGVYEESQRLFRTCFDNFKKGINANITQDKRMDYFYAQDVGRVIEYIIENHDVWDMSRDFNLCYKEKYRLSEYANMIKDLTSNTEDVIIKSNIPAYSYTGDSFLIEDLGIDLIGLQEGIKECLQSWSKS
jgi:UDP-glucose 4-epimerase